MDHPEHEHCRYFFIFNSLKTDDIMAKLKELAPNGVDAYYDNVGGKVSDAVWMNLNKYGKIAQCGLISTYNR